MSVVGFDFGNQTCKIGVARRRGIDVLQNEVGHRSTPTQVGYSGKQRLIGNEASAQQMSNSKNTIQNIKCILGHHYTDNDMKYELNVTSNKLINSNDNILIEVDYNDECLQLTPQQITATVFSKLKKIASDGLDGINISDCVIGCPVWWTQAQRQALLDSANIAGLNVLRLMNETTAIALNWGILKPLPADSKQYVMFIDMGHSNTNVAVVSYTEGKLHVLGNASDRQLGGRYFDDILVSHFADYCKSKYKLDAYTNNKAMAKLRKECERIKLMLSSNNKVPFNIEYFMNDTDVKGMIDRSEFESVVQNTILHRISSVLDQALKNSGITKSQLNAVEIVGGSVRIPIVQNEIAQWYGQPLSKTCDTEESIARGLSLMCAMLSPVFKVKDFDTTDIFQYPIDIEWGTAPSHNDKLSVEDHTLLFPVNSNIPSVKLISFNDRTESFQLQAKYADSSLLPHGTNDILGRFIVSGMPSRQTDVKPPKIKVRVKLDANGLIGVTGAEMLEEIVDNTPAPVPTPSPAPVATPAAAAASPEIDMKDNESNTSDNKSAEPSPTDKMDTEPASTTPAPTAAEPAKPKIKVKKTQLPVTSHLFTALTQSDIQKYFEVEIQMQSQDKLIIETNEARNALEGYILDMKTRIYNDLQTYCTESERTQLESTLNKQEEWLYSDEAETAQKSSYKSHLDECRKLGDIIIQRKYEYDFRPENIDKLQSLINEYTTFYQSTDEKYSHITPEERKKIADYINQINTWLSTSNAAWSNMKSTDNNTITVKDIQVKINELQKFVQPTINKIKPRPTPTPTPEPKKSSTPAPDNSNKSTDNKSSTNDTNKSTADGKDDKPMDTTQ